MNTRVQLYKECTMHICRGQGAALCCYPSQLLHADDSMAHLSEELVTAIESNFPEECMAKELGGKEKDCSKRLRWCSTRGRY